MRTRHTLTLLAALGTFAFGLAGCGGDDDGGSAALRVATYNAGLAPGYVDYTAERAPKTIDAIAGVDAQVLCVQEVWRPEDVDALQAAAGDRFSSAFFLPPDPGDTTGGEAACTNEELDPLQACAETQCAGVDVGELAGCVLAQCATEFGAVSSSCSTCLAANIGSSFSDIRLVCTTAGGGAYAFGGAFGIGLLTDQSVVSQDHIVLDSTYNRRGVLYERIGTDALGDVHVFCTHLSAIFSNIPYPKEGSWEAEQAAQIERLKSWIQEKTGGTGTTLVLGDFNTGPAVGDAQAEAPANYEALVSGGLTDPYAQQSDATCTFCESNPLVGAGGGSVLIDHVLLEGFGGSATGRRILTDPITIQKDGQDVTTAYSDHYGLEVTLTP